MRRLTYTTDTSRVELKVSRAVAQVTSWSVHAQSVDAVHWVGTLVDVWGTQWHKKAYSYGPSRLKKPTSVFEEKKNNVRVILL